MNKLNDVNDINGVYNSNNMQQLRILREIANRELPQYNPEEWLIKKNKNTMYVASMLDYPILAKMKFEINMNKKISYNGMITIPDQFRGMGLGSKLVSVREKFCQELGIEKIIINENENPNFWLNIGFEFMDSQEKEEHIYLNYNFNEPMIKYLKPIKQSINSKKQTYFFKEKKETYSPKEFPNTKIEPEHCGVVLIE
ncbi:MAG: GNAT family N-acetyltransferase [Nanoarchaeota archaeon]